MTKLALIKKNSGLYVMILPAVILTLLFAYRPMYGVIIAFKDYRNSLGITGSPWADPLLRYFTRFFSSFQFFNIVRNTLVISFDDTWLSTICDPPLTVIHQDIALKGTIAAETIIKIINGTMQGRQVNSLPLSIVERESVKLIKNSMSGKNKKRGNTE